MVNKGMLINTAWRLVHDSDSMVAKIIKSEYFPYAILWTAPHCLPKSTFWASILGIGIYDLSLLNWQHSLKECNIQSSRLKEKHIKLQITSQSRLDKQMLLALVCIPVKCLHTVILITCCRHFKTFNGECFAPSLYSVYNY